jgi:hypothetical protein
MRAFRPCCRLQSGVGKSGNGNEHRAFVGRVTKGGLCPKVPQFRYGPHHTLQEEVVEELQVERDGDPDRRGCPLESRQSSTKRMGDHLQFQLTDAMCRSPKGRRTR